MKKRGGLNGSNSTLALNTLPTLNPKQEEKSHKPLKSKDEVRRRKEKEDTTL